MHADATVLPPPQQYSTTPYYEVQDKGSLFLAVVVTLASAALLSFLLRAYTRGIVTRDLGVDDWLVSISTLCVTGVLVTFCLLVKLVVGAQQGTVTSNTYSNIRLYLWILNLFHVIGIGFLKVSITFSLLRVISRRYHRHALYAVVCLEVLITLEFSASIIFQCIPISTVWKLSEEPTGQCMSNSTFRSFDLINSSLNLATDILFAVLSLIGFSTAHLSLRIRFALAVVLCFASTALAAAIARTYLLYRDARTERVYRYDSYMSFWVAIELTTGTTAVCLYALGSSISPTPRFTREIRRIEHPAALPEPTNQQSYHPNISSQTVIYRPGTVYTPVTRFHDDVSNLDFDIETPATRTRTHTMRSRATRNTQSRPASTWSQFSGFTYYTNPAESTIELNRHVSRTPAASELESLVQSLGLGRLDGDGPNIALQLRPLNETKENLK